MDEEPTQPDYSTLRTRFEEGTVHLTGSFVDHSDEGADGGRRQPSDAAGRADTAGPEHRHRFSWGLSLTPEAGEYAYDALERVETLGVGAADVSRVRLPEPADGPAFAVLKEPRLPGRLDEELRAEFLKEANYWRLVDEHQYIVDVIGWGTEPHPWLLVDYVAGGSLAQRAAGSMALDEVLWIGECIADALHHTHTHGLRHFDLKPTNVLLETVEGNPWDVPKVADWGLARFQLEHSGRLTAFTQQYAAPEQFDPETFGAIDNATDLYQLGLLLYELLTGTHPFPDREPPLLAGALTATPPPPSSHDPSLPAQVDAVFEKLLAPRPENRYQAAVLVEEELRDIRTGGAVSASASLADRADLYAKLLERARDESLRECERWLTQVRRFVENNPVEDAGYDDVLRLLDEAVEDRIPAVRTAYRNSETGSGTAGRTDIEAADRELYELVGEYAEEVRRLYLRAS